MPAYFNNRLKRDVMGDSLVAAYMHSYAHNNPPINREISPALNISLVSRMPSP